MNITNQEPALGRIKISEGVWIILPAGVYDVVSGPEPMEMEKK